MPPIEDNVAEDATIEDDTLENGIKTEDETETTEESTESTETEETTTEDDDLWLWDLDELLNNIPDEKEEEKEEAPTEPTHFINKDEEKEEEAEPKTDSETEEVITEEDLNDLDTAFEELETELSDTKTQLEEKSSELTIAEEGKTKYSNALDLLGDHPILGPLNEKLLKGEEVDIPDYLKQSLEDDLDSLPNMEDIAKEPTGTKAPTSLQEKLQQSAKRRH